jgi:hypothetical protein
MALESRKNGNQYYYKKRRIGNRVVSEYWGRGEIAVLMYRYNRLERDQEQARRHQFKAEYEPILAQDNELAQLGELGRMFAQAQLYLAGYYQHHGEWRKARNATTND